jgi:hypothetical protein
MEVKCELCFSIVKRKTDLARHKRSENCKRFSNIIIEKDNIYNKIKKENEERINEILSLKKEIEERINEILSLKKENEDKDKQIKLFQEKSEEYRNIVEKATSTTFKNISEFKNEIIQDNNVLQIDINVTETQLNKAKYKDVPEEIVKKDIQSLKLKNNYQLEYRETDGYINITNLCKAGGKEFKNWNKNDKTKRFLEVLSSTVLIRTVDLLKQEQGRNGERHTWSHPQVAVNIAQWISPEFDVLVSKWVYEIMLTGKVDIRDNKTTQELDKMNIENKLLKNRVKLLESKVLQKQPRETFEDNKNVVYVVTTEYKEAQGHYKIGKAQNLQKRLSTLNTSDKHKVIYNTSCKTKKKMDLLEQVVHDKLEEKRVEPNKEWFLSEEDAEDFIKIIDECKQIVDK